MPSDTPDSPVLYQPRYREQKDVEQSGSGRVLNGYYQGSFGCIRGSLGATPTVGGASVFLRVHPLPFFLGSGVEKRGGSSPPPRTRGGNRRNASDVAFVSADPLLARDGAVAPGAEHEDLELDLLSERDDYEVATGAGAEESDDEEEEESPELTGESPAEGTEVAETPPAGA